MTKKNKVTKKLAKYLIFTILFSMVIGSAYVVIFAPEKEGKEAEVLSGKVNKLAEAPTGDIEEAGEILKAQQKEADDILSEERAKKAAFAEAQKKKPTPVDFMAPSLNAPLQNNKEFTPPRRDQALNAFNQGVSEAQRATVTPEIDDFSTPPGDKFNAPARIPANPEGQLGENDVLIDPNSTSKPKTLDERWRSTYSPVVGPQQAPSKYLLQEGSVIDIALLGNLDTQNPGRIQFRVVSDVYDSLGGRKLLIPKGTKLIGAYGQPPNFGLDRVPISITRAVFADGRSIRLQDTDITDAMGAMGAPAEFHSNIWRAIGPAALVAYIGFKVDESLAEKLPTSSTSTTSAAQTISQSTIPEIQKRVLQSYGTAKPYYTQPAGKRLTLIVASDIAIPPEH